MTTIDLSKTSASVERFLRKAKSEPIVVTRDGKPFAAVMPLDDAEWERIAVASSPVFRKIMERSARRYAKEGGVSAAEARRLLLGKSRRGSK